MSVLIEGVDISYPRQVLFTAMSRGCADQRGNTVQKLEGLETSLFSVSTSVSVILVLLALMVSSVHLLQVSAVRSSLSQEVARQERCR